jgi:hypothetical protein
MVFNIFALLAFISFPLPAAHSTAMAAWMTANLTALLHLIGGPGPIAMERTVALMVTFAVAFTTNPRALRLRARRRAAAPCQAGCPRRSGRLPHP